jgi:hypothetical protein
VSAANLQFFWDVVEVRVFKARRGCERGAVVQQLADICRADRAMA